MKRIIFVCLGNICRSPLAEGAAKKIVKEKGLDYTIDSAGTGHWHVGEAPCSNSQKVALQNGVNISAQRARQVTKEDFKRFDHIVALDSKNMADLKAMGCSNVVKLGSFGYNHDDVPDPYFFNGFEGFDKVYTMIEHCVEELLTTLED